jgi:uncharacterized iron-regulated membrane protein
MSERGLWYEWLNRPQRRPLRRALFQIHLWLALLLGIYIVVISLSGSAVVFRRELSRAFVVQFLPSTEGTRLEGDALQAAVERTYAGDTVIRVSDTPRRPRLPVAVLVEHNGEEQSRNFDPYTAQDLGLSYPPSLEVLEWFVSLHDDLLAGDVGRKINGVAGMLVLVLVLSGAVLWWPGRHRWRQSLYVTPSMPRLLWHLHSVAGFWTLLLLANWALSGVYMAFPGPFENLIDWFDPDLNDFERPGEIVTRVLTQAHFGRFGGLGIRTAWTLLGLVPVLLFVTGFIVWWRRVMRPRLARR